MYKKLLWVLILILCVGAFQDGEAAKKRKRRRRYTGPPPTHPVVLWSRTLSESTDREQRKIAAFKLSQFTQTIYQDPIIVNLTKCTKDPDVQIKVLCTKALARAGNTAASERIRNVLLERYREDPTLRNTVVRVFIARKDNTPKVHDTLLDSAKKSESHDELMVLLGYFEAFGSGSDRYVDTLVDLYNKNDSVKLKRALVKALGEKSEGQDKVIEILSQCSDNKDTPLALTCLGGLQLQAKKDPRAWAAVEKTITSSDPDVIMATLDVINALPENTNVKIATRLVEMIEEMADAEVQEKAVLALGVCGDHSEPIVNTLQKLLEEKNTDESVRVAAALVLGRQAESFPERPKTLLSKCLKEGPSQSLKTACELGIQELEARKSTTTAAQSPSPARTPSEEKKQIEAIEKEENESEPTPKEAKD